MGVGLTTFFSISSYSQNKLDKSKSQLNSFSSNNKQNNISTRTSSSGASNYNNDSNVFVHIFFNITFAIFKYGAIGDYKNEDQMRLGANLIKHNKFAKVLNHALEKKKLY